MTDPATATATATAATTGLTPVAATALAAAATASAMGVEYMHIVAGISGGVVSLWFVADQRAGRSWISLIAGVSLAAFGGPVAGPLLAAKFGLPQVAAGNLSALLLGTFATDIFAGGRGVLRALPEWLYERITGKPYQPGGEP